MSTADNISDLPRRARRPLFVYLDSSDYSEMASRGSCDNHPEFKRLLEWVRAGDIRCFFSGVHIGEMAPVEARHATSAHDRTDALVQLCGRNAMINCGSLFKAELEVALGLRSTMPDVHSDIGEWYPEGMIDLLPLTGVEGGASIKEGIAETGHNRKARRAVQARMLKRGKARPEASAEMARMARSDSLSEMRAKYPMNDECFRVMARFAVGDATVEEANAAFAENVRDPRWMMKWFQQHHDRLNPFIRWVRGPAENVRAGMVKAADQFIAARRLVAQHDASLDVHSLVRSRWKEMQDEALVSIASKVGRATLGEGPWAIPSAETIDAHCPGMSTVMRTYFSVCWASVTATPRIPKQSDFVDAMHSMYVPYVDVFRADSFMAPLIRKQAHSAKTIIVPKLSELPGAIEATLAGA